MLNFNMWKQKMGFIQMTAISNSDGLEEPEVNKIALHIINYG